MEQDCNQVSQTLSETPVSNECCMVVERSDRVQDVCVGGQCVRACGQRMCDHPHAHQHPIANQASHSDPLNPFGLSTFTFTHVHAHATK